jgi:hypothetical protein
LLNLSRNVFIFPRQDIDHSSQASMSAASTLFALKEIATVLTAGGTPQGALWVAGGFAAPSRLKDVEHAIVALRKSFSMEAKARLAREKEAAAEVLGISMSGLCGQQPCIKRSRRSRDKRLIQSLREEGRERKLAIRKLAQGDFDLKSEYI